MDKITYLKKFNKMVQIANFIILEVTKIAIWGYQKYEFCADKKSQFGGHQKYDFSCPENFGTACTFLALFIYLYFYLKIADSWFWRHYTIFSYTSVHVRHTPTLE